MVEVDSIKIWNSDMKKRFVIIGCFLVVAGIFLVISLSGQNSTAQTVKSHQITFLSPKTGDTWNMGALHSIWFNKDLPYRGNCKSYIALLDKENKELGVIALYNQQTLERGQTNVEWDTKTVFKTPCATTQELVPIGPDVYRLKLYQHDEFYSAGEDLRILSEPFVIQQ